MMRLRTVLTGELPAVWQRVAPWLAAALARVPCELTLDGLYGLCTRGDGALVLICDEDGEAVAAGVTQVRDYEDGRRSCWILALGGTGARVWRDTLGVIEAGAARIGCETVDFVGRPGWARLLPDYACAVSYSKRLVAEAAAIGG